MNLKKVNGNRMYKNKDIVNSKKELERKNEIMINRLMILFVLSVTIITFLIIAMNVSAVDYAALYIKYALAGVIVTGVLFVLSVAFFIYNTKKNRSSDKTINKYNVLALFGLLFAYALLIYFKGILVVPVLLAFTIAVTLLTFIYHLYQKEFFWISTLTALGCFMIYFTKTTALNGYAAIMIKILLIALSGATIWTAMSLKKNNGYLNNKKNIKIFDGEAKYFPVWILCGLLACAGVISLITVSFGLYVIVAVLAYFLAIGIYYTIKLI